MKVNAPELSWALRVGETVDLLQDLLEDLWLRTRAGPPLSEACCFVPNHTIEASIEDFACQKFAESLPNICLRRGTSRPRPDEEQLAVAS